MIAIARRYASRETIFIARDTSDDRLCLERRPDGRLWATRDSMSKPVAVRRCFPWSDPMRYISLQDEDGNEFALVNHPAELEPRSHDALVQSLAEASFVFQILGVLNVEEEIEIRVWTVSTGQGTRMFETVRDEWPLRIPGGGLLIRDVAGDLYHAADPKALDAKSQKLLWAFAD
jgi:Domain of unknown function (DUF1854)